MKAIDQYFKQSLEALEKDGLYRRLRSSLGHLAPQVEMDGRQVLQFSSNDYLGLSYHPEVIAGANEALRVYGTGAGASRLVSGNLDIHERLEEALADWLGCEAVLVFSSGSMANLGVFGSMLTDKDTAYLDKQCHATIYDGVRLSGADLKRFKHQDFIQLESMLRASEPGQRKMIGVESVYSMDGDQTDLRSLCDLTRRHGAWLMVDEAHAVGVLGKEGRGLIDAQGLSPEAVDVRVGTFSKAFGGQGGFVAGSRLLKEYLLNRSRSMIFATALSPVAAGAALAALGLIRRDAVRRERLRLNRDFLEREFRRMGLKVLNPAGPILPVLMGDPQTVMKAHNDLWDQGIFVPAIRPPTVAKSVCRLRISVTSEHSIEQLETLLNALKKAVRVPTLC